MRNLVSSFLIVIILMGMGIVFVACDNGDNTSENTIVDMAGATVEIPEQINKIICTSQNALEFIVAMGEADKIIGTHRSVLTHTWSKEYIPNIDDMLGFGYTPSAEAMYEVGVDLVILKDSAAAEELRNAGITAITFKYGNKNEMFSAVRLLGKLFGEKASSFAEEWIECYEQTASFIQNKVTPIAIEDRIDAYFIDASGSLDSTGLTSTVGGDNIAAEWFDTIGINLITKQYTNITSINEEEILEINPEAIVIGGWCENSIKEQLLSDSKWANVDAVKNGNIFLVPVGFVSFERYAVEAPLLLEYMASQIYPHLFEYDAVSEFKDFFNEYFGIDVSAEKINYMLNGYNPDGSRMD